MCGLRFGTADCCEMGAYVRPKSTKTGYEGYKNLYLSICYVQKKQYFCRRNDRYGKAVYVLGKTFFLQKNQASSCVCEKKVVSLQRPIVWQGVYIDNPSVFSRVNLVNLRYEKLMRRIEPQGVNCFVSCFSQALPEPSRARNEDVFALFRCGKPQGELVSDCSCCRKRNKTYKTFCFDNWTILLFDNWGCLLLSEKVAGL